MAVKDKEAGPMFEKLKKLFAKKIRRPRRFNQGTITRTCRICGKTFTLPDNVQHWPDLCQECRAKHRPAETLTRKCKKCGKPFTFSSNARHWPKYCPKCLESRGQSL